MTSNGRILVALLPPLLALGACGLPQDNARDAGGTLDAANCSMLPGWTRIDRVDAGGSTVAHVGGGALTMTADYLPWNYQVDLVAPTGTVEITQGGQATGDFEATATFDSFRGTAPGGAAGLVISTPGSGDAYAFIRQTDTPQLEVMVAGMGTAMVPASEVGGTLRVARHAGMMTATATAGTSTVELVGAFPAGNLTMAAKLGIYNRSETDNPGETSIRFTDFAITGSTDLLSDAFDCDSVP